MVLKTFHFVPGLSRTPLLFIPRYLTNIFFRKYVLKKIKTGNRKSENLNLKLMLKLRDVHQIRIAHAIAEALHAQQSTLQRTHVWTKSLRLHLENLVCMLREHLSQCRPSAQAKAIGTLPGELGALRRSGSAKARASSVGFVSLPRRERLRATPCEASCRTTVMRGFVPQRCDRLFPMIH